MKKFSGYIFDAIELVLLIFMFGISLFGVAFMLTLIGWAIIPPLVVLILVVVIVAYILKRHDEKKGRR